MATVKCKLCGKSFVDKKGLVKHIDKVHADQIPEGWTAARYENYLRTHKTHGTCVICKEDTEWNDVTEKYCRFCNKQSCKDTARKIAEENLMKARGITHSQMLNDPEFQRKMIYSKKTSGVYKFSTSSSDSEIHYDSSYGKDFLEMLDYFMGFHQDDILGPSPNTYVYEYEGKTHFYIPDYYIPSLNLEVEIKDGGNNPNKHPKIQAVDKVKERLKDEAMRKAKVNYVKIANKNYTTFYKILFEIKEKEYKSSGPVDNSKFSFVIESALGNKSGKDNGTELFMLSSLMAQVDSIKTDSEKTEMLDKLDRMEDAAKHVLNIQDDLQKRANMNIFIQELNFLKDRVNSDIDNEE